MWVCVLKHVGTCLWERKRQADKINAGKAKRKSFNWPRLDQLWEAPGASRKQFWNPLVLFYVMLLAYQQTVLPQSGRQAEQHRASITTFLLIHLDLIFVTSQRSPNKMGCWGQNYILNPKLLLTVTFRFNISQVSDQYRWTDKHKRLNPNGLLYKRGKKKRETGSSEATSSMALLSKVAFKKGFWWDKFTSNCLLDPSCNRIRNGWHILDNRAVD